MSNKLVGRDLADFGHARLRDILFDAVSTLWRQRQTEGLTVEVIAERIERSADWVQCQLSAPGEWTLQTAGELIQGLDGETEITIHDLIGTEPSQAVPDTGVDLWNVL